MTAHDGAGQPTIFIVERIEEPMNVKSCLLTALVVTVMIATALAVTWWLLTPGVAL